MNTLYLFTEEEVRGAIIDTLNWDLAGSGKVTSENFKEIRKKQQDIADKVVKLLKSSKSLELSKVLQEHISFSVEVSND